jgi:hypothetical protein
MSILPEALTGIQKWPLYYFLIPALATLLGIWLSDMGWSWKTPLTFEISKVSKPSKSSSLLLKHQSVYSRLLKTQVVTVCMAAITFPNRRKAWS